MYKKNLYHSLFGTGWHMGGRGRQDGDEHSLVSRWGHHRALEVAPPNAGRGRHCKDRNDLSIARGRRMNAAGIFA